MKKIMFNDLYGLTQAVLDGRKTMTRRIITPEPTNILHWSEKFRKCSNCFYSDERGLCELHSEEKLLLPKYKVGEVVAVAQSYKNAGYDKNKIFYRSVPEVDGYRKVLAIDDKGWNNKMFVCANLMPHQVRILNVRAERLQDITEEDCLREGIYKDECKTYFNGYAFDLTRCEGNCILATQWYKSPREAYASLIDKISGKGTWERNPFVWVYEFELIKN